MKLGEIKIEALKLMFASYDRDLSLAKMDDLKADSAFRDLLYNMPPAINRAFSIIENRGVLRDIVQTYSPSSAEPGMPVSVPECLTASHGELGGMLHMITYRVSVGFSWIPFTDVIGRSDGNVLLPSIVAGEEYAVHYAPQICRVTSVTSDDVDIPILPDVACLIPYYIKSEVYREEDAEEANNARTWFDAGLTEIVKHEIRPSGVNIVFGGMI